MTRKLEEIRSGETEKKSYRGSTCSCVRLQDLQKAVRELDGESLLDMPREPLNELIWFTFACKRRTLSS